MLVVQAVAGNLPEGIDLRGSRHVVSSRRGVRGGRAVRVGVVQGPEGRFAAQVLADRDEFHLGRHDALAGVPELGDRMVLATQGLPLEAGVFLELVPGGLVLVELAGVCLGEIAIVLGPGFAALVFLDVPAGQDPFAAQGRKALGHLALEVGIAPRAGTIVHADRRILLDPAVRMSGVGERDLTQGHAKIRVVPSLDVDASGSGEGARGFLRGSLFFRTDHGRCYWK